MTGCRRTTLAVAIVALLAGCGGGSQTAEPSPAVASSPSPRATPAEVAPTEAATATAEPAPASPAITTHAGHTAAPTRDPRPPTAITIRLTEKDAGRTIRVRLGTLIVVELAGGAGSFRRPSTDAPGVLRADSTSGGYPAQGPATATFTAIAKGAAQITSTTDAACLHTQPACMIPQQQFTVTIRVTA